MGFGVESLGFRVERPRFRPSFTQFVQHTPEKLTSGFGVQGFGFQVSGFGYRVWNRGVRVQGLGCRVLGSGFRVWGVGSGFRVLGFGSRVSGLPQSCGPHASPGSGFGVQGLRLVIRVKCLLYVVDCRVLMVESSVFGV